MHAPRPFISGLITEPSQHRFITPLPHQEDSARIHRLRIRKPGRRDDGIIEFMPRARATTAILRLIKILLYSPVMAMGNRASAMLNHRIDIVQERASLLSRQRMRRRRVVGRKCGAKINSIFREGENGVDLLHLTGVAVEVDPEKVGKPDLVSPGLCSPLYDGRAVCVHLTTRLASKLVFILRFRTHILS